MSRSLPFCRENFNASKSETIPLTTLPQGTETGEQKADLIYNFVS